VQYFATRNPLYAWSAYAEARAWKVAIPQWVHDYLDEAWRNLMFLKRRRPRKHEIARAIAAALGFVRGGVTVTSWKQAWEDPRDLARYAVRGRRPDGSVNPFLRKTGGAYNPFDDSNHFPLAFAVFQALVDGHQLLYAYEHIAQQHGVARRTVERAWAIYKDYLPVDTK
jgi:hypothetical protein